MSDILGIMLCCLPGVLILLLLVLWQNPLGEIFQKPACTCDGTLRRYCPQHGWEQAEPIGPVGAPWIEYMLGQYLKDEAKDGAWFEKKLEEELDHYLSPASPPASDP